MPDLNPLSSIIDDIFLGNDSIFRRNEFCQFEKIEFIESVFEIFPSGSLIVRDTSDIMTKVINGEIQYITLSYTGGQDETFFITGVMQANNAGSSTEENFISINFSNELFKVNQTNTVCELLGINYPNVYDIYDLFDQISSGLFSKIGQSSFEDLVTNVESFENYVVVRPLNPTETKVDVPSDNPLQYLNYISSLSCSMETGQPRFLFWTGFNNQIYFKYFYDTASNDPDSSNFKTFATYEADVPSATVRGKTREKIYMLTTVPANQYLNRKYYYIRKTPKILNNPAISYEEENEELLFNHQYLDDGIRYDYELVTEYGVVDSISTSSGYNILPYNGSYGYYTQGDVDSMFATTSLLSMDYGNENIYDSKNILSIQSPYPFVDTSQMWKNMFDLTTVNPNQGQSSFERVSGSDTNLQKVFQIRQDARVDTTKKDTLKDIEKQNFIWYVLCCMKNRLSLSDLSEETFFACITGWDPDPDYYWDSQDPIIGFNDEPLIYRYYWRRLSAVLSDLNDFTKFSNPENLDRWEYVDEQSTSYETMAINLNERVNLGPEQFFLGYYGSGWYSYNLLAELFKLVTYRPIGNDGGALDEFYDPTGDPCLHIVRMHKIPYTKIILEAKNFSEIISTAQDLETILENAQGKYVYFFELTNVTDGPCNIVESPPPPPPPPPPEEFVGQRAQRTEQ